MGRLAASLRLAGRPGLDAGSRGAAGPAGRGRAAGRLLGLRGRRFFGRERGFAGSEGTMRRLLPAGQEVGAGGAGVPGRLRGVCVGFGRASEEKKGGFSSAGRWRSSEFPARALWQSSAAQPRQREVFIGPLGRSWGDLTNFSCFEKGGEGVGSSEAIGALRPGAGRTSGFSEVVLAGVRLQSWQNCLGPVPLSSRRFGTNLKSFPACRLTTTCSAKLPARFLAMKAFFLPVAVFFFFFSSLDLARCSFLVQEVGNLQPQHASDLARATIQAGASSVEFGSVSVRADTGSLYTAGQYPFRVQVYAVSKSVLEINLHDAAEVVRVTWLSGGQTLIV